MLIWIAATALSYLAASVRFAISAERERKETDIDG